jgi:Zn-dependent protease with chaperone function
MSNNKFLKYLNISLIAMFVISVFLIFFVVKDSDDNVKLQGSLDSNFYWAYLLFLLAVAGIVFFSVYQAITIKGDSKKTLIAVVGMFVVVLIAYLMSSTEIPQFYGTKALVADGTLTPKTAQMTDTGLYTSYILALLTVCALIYTSVSKIWSK